MYICKEGDFMTKEEQVFKIMENNNDIVTTKMIEDEGISRIYLSKMVENNQIERIKSGVYGKKDKFVDEYYLYQIKHPNAVFSFNTALFINGMTEKTPDKIDVTVYSGYSDNRKSDNIKIHFVKKDLLNLGIEIKESPYGNKVKVYDIERTICDIVKYQNKFDPEQWGKTMRNYFFHGRINYGKIMDYAEQLGIYNLIRPYINISI